MRFSFYKHWENKKIGESIFYYISLKLITLTNDY